MRASSPPVDASPKHSVCSSRGWRDAASSSSARKAASHSACVTCPFSMIWPSSFARSSGIVPTAVAPAFITANQQATSIGLFAARSSTRLPGTTPRSGISTFAMRLAWLCRSA